MSWTRAREALSSSDLPLKFNSLSFELTVSYFKLIFGHELVHRDVRSDPSDEKDVNDIPERSRGSEVDS